MTKANTQLAPSTEPPIKIMVVAGEASGDSHAASVVKSLHEIYPNVKVFGMGGSKLRAVGMETTVDSEHSASVMGFTEVIGSFGKIVAAFTTLVRIAKERKPDVAIMLDYPDFNLRLIKRLHRLNIPVLYYISPQLWAWRPGRVKTVKKYVSKVATIFPFETDFYRLHQVDAEYVGHPFLEHEEVKTKRFEFFESINLDPTKPVVAMLPGSRKAEVQRLLPVMLEGVEEVQKSYPDCQAVVPIASTLDRSWVEEIAGTRGGKVTFISEQSRELLAVADAAVIASGTATVEAALAEIPFTVIYKLSPLTYRIARLLVTGVKQFAMANLIAGKSVVKEFLQEEANAKNIGEELKKLLSDEGYVLQMKQELQEVRKALQTKKSDDVAAKRVATIALELGGVNNPKEVR